MLEKLLNIFTLVIQVIVTFFLMLAIYMVFALLDSDFGFDGIFGYIVIQPLLGTIISLITVFAGLLIGLPVRFNGRLRRWWVKHSWISILGIITGLLLLVISMLPQYRESVTVIIDEVEMVKEKPNAILAYSGWCLTAFMSLHFFLPEFLVRNILQRLDRYQG